MVFDDEVHVMTFKELKVREKFRDSAGNVLIRSEDLEDKWGNLYNAIIVDGKYQGSHCSIHPDSKVLPVEKTPKTITTLDDLGRGELFYIPIRDALSKTRNVWVKSSECFYFKYNQPYRGAMHEGRAGMEVVREKDQQ